VYADGIVSQQTWEGKQVLSARLHESHCPVHRAIIKGDEIFVGGNGVVNVFKIDENQELKVCFHNNANPHNLLLNTEIGNLSLCRGTGASH